MAIKVSLVLLRFTGISPEDFTFEEFSKEFSCEICGFYNTVLFYLFGEGVSLKSILGECQDERK